MAHFASRIIKRIRSNRTRLFLAASIAILAAALTLASVATDDAIHLQSNQAQTSGTASTRAQSNKAYILNSGLWRTDGGFVSTIRVKNVLVVAPMDVVPVLFMADGTPYMLPSVHVGVSGVATININDALAAAPSAVASHISQYGSAALIYSYSSPGHVTAQIAAIDGSRSLSFVFPFAEPMGEPMRQTVEGLWWKRDPGVSGFVALSNVTDTDTQASMQLVSHGNSAQAERTIALPAHSTRMLHLEDFADNPSPLAKQAGGIRVQYTARGSRAAFKLQGGSKTTPRATPPTFPFGGMIRVPFRRARLPTPARA